MKSPRLLLPRPFVIATALWLCASAVKLRSQVPEEATVSLTRGVAAGTLNVSVTDYGNFTWTLQSSPDLSHWTDVETLKVHNGNLRRILQPAPGTAGLFFRTQYSDTAPALTSTTATALLFPVAPYNYATPTLPPSFSVNPIAGQDNTPVDNPVTNAGARLGRALFYDKRLSFNQTISCSSCHRQEFGFSDNKKFSTGFHGGLTGRNSMGLANARWYQRRAFFWDERAATLEDQVLQPIQNSVEMGMTLTALVTRLSAEPYYADLFTQAFGTSQVTTTRISRALAQFVRSIISTRTKFDTGRATGFANFTAQENLGFQVFTTPQLGGCVACHGTDNFVPGGAINNNGLDLVYTDKGVGDLTGRPQDEGLFKVPSLRNIELTAPYMHDGRFATLEEVVEFYNSQVAAHPNLSPPLRAPGPGVTPRRLNLTAQQKAGLVAFLKTLTDTTLATNPEFADPFNYGP